MEDDALTRIRDKEIEGQIQRHGYGQHLFHYTSVNALFSILKSRELWLGNLSSMNDKSEVAHFIDELHTALLENLPQKFHSKCEELFVRIHERQINEYPYALCLSRLSDDAAQWDRYANHGAGVCIAFNTRTLMSLMCGGCFLSEVFYEYDITAHDHYHNLFNYISKGSLEPFGSETSLLDNVFLCAYIHKHQSFSAEKEVRAATLWTRMPWENNPEFNTERFICSEEIIKKVLVLKLDKVCITSKIDFEDLFDSITIGPCSKQSSHGLQDFISSLGYSKLARKVCVSQCPLQ